MDERRLLLVGFAREGGNPLSVLAGHLRVAERCLARVKRVEEEVKICGLWRTGACRCAEALDLAMFVWW